MPGRFMNKAGIWTVFRLPIKSNMLGNAKSISSEDISVACATVCWKWGYERCECLLLFFCSLTPLVICTDPCQMPVPPIVVPLHAQPDGVGSTLETHTDVYALVQQDIVPILIYPNLVPSQAVFPPHQLKDDQPCTCGWNLSYGVPPESAV